MTFILIVSMNAIYLL